VVFHRYLICFLLSFGAVQAAEKPNIIVILFDDMGYGAPAAYRPESGFKTPTMDRLAAEGMIFTDAHSAAANCTPTRYGFLTGRYPWRIQQFGVLGSKSPAIIPEDRLTIAAMLKNQGYRTGCFGKWHLGMNWISKSHGEQDTDKFNKKELKKLRKAQKKKNTLAIGSRLTGGPLALGFDRFVGFTHAGNIGMLIVDNAVTANLEPVEVQPRITKEALAFIDKYAKTKDPFFLYFPLAMPHSPHVPAPEFVGKSGAGNYGDWIFQGDQIIAKVLKALDRHGISENTLLIMTADNGSAKNKYPPLRGKKRYIYEGGHRIPLIARWPGVIKAGSQCDQTISINDIFATCASLVKVKLPDDAAEDSFDVLPYFLGKTAKPIHAEGVMGQNKARELCIRQDEWKLVFHPPTKDGSGRFTIELFNLNNDISETKDVASEFPERVKALSSLIKKYIRDGRSRPGPAQAPGPPFWLHDALGLN